MNNKLEIFKKKLIYRAGYRGTKEMDILLSAFVNKYINTFDENLLVELEKFLNFEDEVILNFYHNNLMEKDIQIFSLIPSCYLIFLSSFVMIFLYNLKVTSASSAASCLQSLHTFETFETFEKRKYSRESSRQTRVYAFRRSAQPRPRGAAAFVQRAVRVRAPVRRRRSRLRVEALTSGPSPRSSRGSNRCVRVPRARRVSSCTGSCPASSEASRGQS